MIKTLAIWFFAVILSYATQTILPLQQIDVGGVAKDIIVKDSKLYVGIDMGKLRVYDYIQEKFIKDIEIPTVKDFTGEVMPARVASIDYLDGRYLLLSDSGIMGYTNLRMHENNTTVDLFDHTEKVSIVKVRFIDTNRVLMGTLGNEAVLFDIEKRKEIYREQLTPSKFSDFALTKDKKLAVFGCESGVMSIIDTSTGKVVKELKGINLDNTYKVDMKSGIVAGAGQDRKGSIYDAETGKGDFIEGSFLIYAAGLSPSAKRVAFAMDEKNNIYVYNTSTKSQIALLKGQKSTLNAIVFVDENTIFSASDDRTVMMWKLN